jgi:hypothetical protein
MPPKPRGDTDSSPGNGPDSLLGRAWSLAQREGPVRLVSVVIRRYLFDSRTFLLYEYDHASEACRRLPPLPEGFDESFVENNEVADAIAEKRCDFRRLVPAARHALDCAAVALCIYHGDEVAHVGWLATTERARRSLDPLEFEVAFDRGVAWLGSVYTVPKFRNRGLLTYSALRRFAYVREAGFNVSRSAVERDNAASNRVQVRFDPRIYATAHLLKVCGRRRWRETPVVPGVTPDVSPSGARAP